MVCKSATQKRRAQSVCETELNAGFSCAQEMLYTKHVLELIGLRVELTMLLEMDNKGVDHKQLECRRAHATCWYKANVSTRA